MRGVRPPKLISSFETPQFDAQNGCLDAVHPAVPPDHGVVILADLTMVPKRPDLFLQPGVISYHRTSLAECAKILSGVKAETSGLAKRADLSPLVFGPMSLAGILNDEQTVLTRHFP